MNDHRPLLQFGSHDPKGCLACRFYRGDGSEVQPRFVQRGTVGAITAAKLPNFAISAFATGFTSPRCWAANRMTSSNS